MGTLDTLDKLGVEVAAVPHDGLQNTFLNIKVKLKMPAD